MAADATRVAVIGFGPRGLGALEALGCVAKEQGKRVVVDIYDPFAWPGAGPNFDPEQSPLCLLNIPVRDLDIPPPAVVEGRIAPFDVWDDTGLEPDDFPSRAHLGAYLNARFETLQSATEALSLNMSDQRITDLEQSADRWMLHADAARLGPYDEVLLTLGQPATEQDKQIAKWTEHAQAHGLDIMTAYPADKLLQGAQDWAGKTIAVRGLGLSTFDVIRLLTSGLGGTFEDGRYIPSGREPSCILPFALNGHPPAGKPATEDIDAWFEPSGRETHAFEAALEAAKTASPVTALRMICEALAPPATRILAERGSDAGAGDVDAWLAQECDAPGEQDDRDAVDKLRSDIDMAHGRVAPSVGYVVGQIWRKWQNQLRHGVNAGRPETKTAEAIIGFDEGLKRFSYGPPVAAAEELLALIEQGLVSLRVVDDPDIGLEPSGWKLMEDDTELASVMVDAVLPSPSLDNVVDHLMSACIKSGLAQRFADGLGALTRTDGQLMADGRDTRGLCLLGRMAMGSVIAVDSLHDCFGASTDRWAAGVAQRWARASSTSCAKDTV
ncbi:FAD/NAD(P)-binding protein [Litoreibacter albidus]|uniref:FAD/NAD(P)-binding protein n=1 Tax=Litoreibacter albidus TaxID=670155 RepID=UPI003736C6AA